MPRKLLTLLFLLTLAVAAAPAKTAPPPRDDGMTEPVYLVHGYSVDGTDCEQRWGPAMETWRRAGWEGELHTVGYYAGDSSCNTKIAATNRSTPIQQLGSQLAWDIYLQYSSHGRSVDVVGHSMGGLIARVALTGVSRGWEGFPPFLYVEDAVTLGTPHGGVSASWVRSCDEMQCVQMRPGSKFLTDLASVGQNPQSSQGTDWTLIGSEDDHTVAWQSAVASRAEPNMRPGHRVLYKSGEGISHGDLASTVSGDRTYRLSYSRGTGPVQRTEKGRSPVYPAGGAIKWWSKS